MDRLHFLLQQVTALSHAYPKSFVAVVVMPNRAGDLKANGCKPLGFTNYLLLFHDFHSDEIESSTFTKTSLLDTKYIKQDV